MKTLYLHIGQTKTGSTALQSFMHRNRALLRGQGWLYPLPPESSPLRQQHRFLAEAVGESRGRPESAAQVWTPFLQRLADAPEERLLLSEETLWHVGQGQKEARRRWIHWMAEQLRGFEVHVVCYLRRQDLWLESWYQQTAKAPVHRAVTPMDLPTFSAHHEQQGAMDYSSLLQDWEEAFGRHRVRVRVYDRQRLHQGDSIADFCEWLGIAPDPRFAAPTAQQERLGAAHADVSRMFATVAGCEPHRRDFLGLLQRTPFAARPSGQSLMDAQAARELLTRCEDTNAQVAERHGLPVPLFAGPDRPEFAETPPSLSSPEVLQLVLRLYVALADKHAALDRELQELRQSLPR